MPEIVVEDSNEISDRSVRAEVRHKVITRINVLLVVLFVAFIASSAFETVGFLVLNNSISHNAGAANQKIAEAAKTGYLGNCRDINSLRDGLLRSLDNQLARSKKTLDQSLHDPTVSPERRVALAASYAGGVAFLDRLKHDVPEKSCIYPTTTLSHR